MPEGLWVKCGSCKEILYRKDVLKNLSVCPKCAFHFRISARERLDTLFDGAWEEFDRGLVSADPLGFRDTKPYAERLRAGKAKTDSWDALVSAVGDDGRPAHGDRRHGVRLHRRLDGRRGGREGHPRHRAGARGEAARCVIVSCSGGARMMEGTLSLMQMAKISAALARLHEARLPFLSVLTDPTTGGVTASFAMLGDLNIAEPGALIGFAGPRVIEQTIRQKLPEGFQRSEFLLEHGMLDMVVDRRELKKTLVRSLQLLMD